MKREEGYYWVKLTRINSQWEVAYYNIAGWNLTGLQSKYHDSDFDEIDENRIERRPNIACKDDNGIYAD